MVVANHHGPDGSSATLYTLAALFLRRETQVSVELGLIVPGKTSLIIPQLRGIIRAIRTAWFTKPRLNISATNKPGQDGGGRGGFAGLNGRKTSKEVRLMHSRGGTHEFFEARFLRVRFDSVPAGTGIRFDDSMNFRTMRTTEKFD